MGKKITSGLVSIWLLGIALGAILLIQIFWILESANEKEALFNEKAKWVLNQVSEALALDPALLPGRENRLSSSEQARLDSLVRFYLNRHGLQTDFHFDIRTGPGQESAPARAATASPVVSRGILLFGQGRSDTFQHCMPNPDSRGDFLNLKLAIPEKATFIEDELGPLFFSSVLLIGLVLVMGFRSFSAMEKEKRIAQNTLFFLQNMTHELNTPLANMGLAGKLLAKDPASLPTEKGQKYLSVLLEENHRMRQLVDQALHLSALEKGELVFPRSDCDVHEVLQEAIERFATRFEDRKMEAKLNFQAAPSILSANPFHLLHVFCNLIDNALKYSRAGTALTITTEHSNRRLLISFSDEGMGIPVRYHTRIFESFFRVPTGDLHAVKGHGLGLAYAWKIVRLHGGQLTVKSTPGKGSTFQISLPYAGDA